MKIIKWTGVFLGVFVLFCLLVVILLITFVNPNRLKPLLIAEVTKATGREFKMDGDLSWTFFPSIGVKVGHMILNNPAGFAGKTFAEVSSATVGVKMLPLLHGQIQSSGVTLNGVKLYLIK